jgi:hypothetical protein
MSTKLKATVRVKREEAQERQRYRQTLTAQQQLNRLDQRPGASKKERAKLTKQVVEDHV